MGCYKRRARLSQLLPLQRKTNVPRCEFMVVKTNVVLSTWKLAGLIYNYGVQPGTNMDRCETFFAQSKILFTMQQLMLDQ